jgi:hypothetical protein
MTLRSVHFVAIVLAALALVPAGAHLFALPNKIGMGQGQYFTAQSVYSGWALLGFVLIGALIANGALAMLVRDETAPFRFALAATICFTLSLIVFLVWVFPAIRRRTIGPPCRTTGARCACAGSTAMRSARSCALRRCARRRSRL